MYSPTTDETTLDDTSNNSATSLEEWQQQLDDMRSTGSAPRQWGNYNITNRYDNSIDEYDSFLSSLSGMQQQCGGMQIRRQLPVVNVDRNVTTAVSTPTLDDSAPSQFWQCQVRRQQSQEGVQTVDIQASLLEPRPFRPSNNTSSLPIGPSYNIPPLQRQPPPLLSSPSEQYQGIPLRRPLPLPEKTFTSLLRLSPMHPLRTILDPSPNHAEEDGGACCNNNTNNNNNNNSIAHREHDPHQKKMKKESSNYERLDEKQTKDHVGTLFQEPSAKEKTANPKDTFVDDKKEEEAKTFSSASSSTIPIPCPTKSPSYTSKALSLSSPSESSSSLVDSSTSASIPSATTTLSTGSTPCHSSLASSSRRATTKVKLDYHFMGQLKTLMIQSEKTQHLLQEWDEQHGLPKSHSQTMVNSSRSRRQLQEGIILPKWDGSPLITTTSTHVGDSCVKEMIGNNKLKRRHHCQKSKDQDNEEEESYSEDSMT